MDKMTAQHPLYDRNSSVMNAELVTLDAGTGLVLTAPGLGEDEVQVGMKYGLPVITVVDAQGYLNENAPGFEGVFYDDAQQLDSKALDEKGALLKLDFYSHSYPHDWRTQKPVIFRATTTWFAYIEAFRDTILKAIDTVDFKPSWGQTRL